MFDPTGYHEYHEWLWPMLFMYLIGFGLIVNCILNIRKNINHNRNIFLLCSGVLLVLLTTLGLLNHLNPDFGRLLSSQF
jgi:hypothetical protein